MDQEEAVKYKDEVPPNETCFWVLFPHGDFLLEQDDTCFYNKHRAVKSLATVTQDCKSEWKIEA